MPTVTIGANTTDTYSGVTDNEMREGDAFTNQDSVTAIETSKFGSGDYRNISIKFSGLSNISAGSTITSATLYLYLTAAGGSGDVISFYRILRNWQATEATWTIYSTGNSWTSGGARSVGNDVASATGTASVGTSTGAYVAFTGLASDVQGIIDGTYGNYGWMLDRTDSANDSHFRVWASSEGTNGQRPYLEVTYTAGGGTTYLLVAN